MHTNQFFAEVIEIVNQIDKSIIESLAIELKALRDRSGRLFILGVGGSAANSSYGAITKFAFDLSSKISETLRWPELSIISVHTLKPLDNNGTWEELIDAHGISINKMLKKITESI